MCQDFRAEGKWLVPLLSARTREEEGMCKGGAGEAEGGGGVGERQGI